MKNTQSTTQAVQLAESLSALADGQLKGGDFAQTLDACGRDPGALTQWSTYCLIGDALRSPELAQTADDQAFLLKLRARLAQEPSARVLHPAELTAVQGAGVGAANEAGFGWKLAVGFASVAAIAVISWGTMTHLMAPGASSTQLAHVQGNVQQVLVPSEQGTMLRDARLEELLAAHRQLGGGSVLQVPADFLHSAVFDAQQSVKP